MSNSIDQFKNAMLDAGVQPPEIIYADNQLHRFSIKTDKRGNLNGWYILHIDGRPAGAFGHWRTGATHIWKSDSQQQPMTASQKAAFKSQCEKVESERKLDQEARHKQAADKAGWIWENSNTQPFIHPYLSKKHIKPHGVRLYKDALVVPIYSDQFKLVNLQFISPNGDKRFLSGGRKSGCFCPFTTGTPTIDDLKILITEGYATGMTLLEQTGHFVAVAFDAGNLKPVAVMLRRKYPNSEIIVCGDNDESGIGQAKAKEAAIAAHCKYVIPQTIGDFNDLHIRGELV